MIPVKFEYIEQPNEFFDGERVFVTLLGRIKHYYTGEIMYRVRKEGTSGWITELYYSESDIRAMLKKKVEAEV